MSKKIKIREIKNKLKVREVRGEDEFEDEEVDDSLTDEEIRLIIAHKVRMRIGQKSGNNSDSGLKQDFSALEKVAQEAPVSEAVPERSDGEQKRDVKYSDPSGGGKGGYDSRRGYMDTGKYQEVDASLSEDRMARDAREARQRADGNPFDQGRLNDNYTSLNNGDTEEQAEKKKRQLL